MQTALEQEATTVLALLSRAHQLFGAAVAPVDAPAFAAPLELEDDLGRGWF